MSALEIYHNYGFKLFLCKADKSPDTTGDWRLEENQLTLQQAEKWQQTGRMIGAWIPEGVIVLDLDEHKDKPSGKKAFKEIKKDYNITTYFEDETLVVETGGGGLHVFFTTDQAWKQNTKVPGIDLKTNKGYVIAAGSPGYRALSEYDPMPLPENLGYWLESFEQKKEEVKEIIEQKEEVKLLPIKMAKQILSKVNVKNYDNNDKWIAFVMSCLSAFGNTPDVHQIIDEWSCQDERYGNDRTVLKRIQSFEQIENITIGSFIHFLKEEGLSPYYINKIINRETINNLLIQGEESEIDLPFCQPDYSEIARKSSAIEFFDFCGNTSAASVLEIATNGYIIYSDSENTTYYFNGNRWIELNNYYSVIYTVLFRVLKIKYNQSPTNEESDTKFLKVVSIINNKAWKDAVWSEFIVKDTIFRKSIQWDGIQIKETITTKDGVIDFTGQCISKRTGLQSEYRKTFIDITTDEILSSENPVNFLQYLTDIFPDEATKETVNFCIGLCISGNASKRKFQIWTGNGSNGKSTLQEIIKECIGNKAITYPSQMILYDKFGSKLGVTPELVPFQGAYVAFGGEVEMGQKFSVGKIKNLTGDETITANPKFKNQIEFPCTWQMVLCVNDLPMFNGTDIAFIDRLILVPFVIKYVTDEDDIKRELTMGAKREHIRFKGDKSKIIPPIMAERAAIIKWMIERYIELQRDKKGVIPESKECKYLKMQYIKENDEIGMFIDSCCIVERDKDYKTTLEEITKRFRDFTGNQKTSTQYITKSLKKATRSTIEDTWKYEKDFETGKFKKHRALLNIILIDENEIGTKEKPELEFEEIERIAKESFTLDPDEEERKALEQLF
jgi:P4 family phage/plasmid primase-like protien